jgi:hypothetical protein
MHKPSAYEQYLHNEIQRYGWKVDEENDIPCWLFLEFETYYWIFRLSRKIYKPLDEHTVSKKLLRQIEQIPTIRFLRYRDISPALKGAINEIADEFNSLQEDLKNPEMWKKPYVLSKAGLDRWQKTTELVNKCQAVQPDPEWRENWEKENLRPYCTRREAEAIAFDYVKKNKGIDLTEINPEDGKHKYYYILKAKDGIFKMRYGLWSMEGNPFHDKGVIEVDMLSNNVKEIIGV